MFLEVLNTEFVSRGPLNPQTAAPLDIEVYLRRVLVPETAVRLIEWDQRCTRSKALEILEESREYGAAVYGDTELSERFFKQTQAEKSRRAKEEEIAVSRREDLISSQGDAGEALRLGEAFIAKLRKCMHRA